MIIFCPVVGGVFVNVRSFEVPPDATRRTHTHTNLFVRHTTSCVSRYAMFCYHSKYPCMGFHTHLASAGYIRMKNESHEVTASAQSRRHSFLCFVLVFLPPSIRIDTYTIFLHIIIRMSSEIRISGFKKQQKK